MLFLIYDPWKDPNGAGQPDDRAAARSPSGCPLLGTQQGARRHRRSPSSPPASCGGCCARPRWGFQLRVVGGNPEAARRAGLRVGAAAARRHARRRRARRPRRADPARRRRVQAAARLPRHLRLHRLPRQLAGPPPTRPGGASPPSLLAAISIGGDSLQIDSQLPAATVNILMALVLLAVFGWTGKRRRWHEHEPRRRSARPARVARRHVDPVRRPRRDVLRDAPAWSTSAPRAPCSSAPSPPTPSPPRPATRGSASLAGAVAGGAARPRPRLLRARPRAPTSSPPAWSCCSSASGSPRCSAPPTCSETIDAFTHVGRPAACRDIPWHRRDLLPARPADLPLVPARAGGLVGAVPQPVGPADPRRRRAHRGARHLRPPRRSSCSTSRSSSAACSPASAAPSCRPPTPTPGSRT